MYVVLVEWLNSINKNKKEAVSFSVSLLENWAEFKPWSPVFKVSWPISCDPEPDDEGQRLRGRYKAKVSAHCLTVLCYFGQQITDQLLSVCSREDGRKTAFSLVLITSWCHRTSATSEAPFPPGSPGKWGNVMPKGSFRITVVNEADSLMEAFPKTERQELSEMPGEKRKHVLCLMFGNWAEPLMQGRGSGARFRHTHHLSRKYVPATTLEKPVEKSQFYVQFGLENYTTVLLYSYSVHL